MIPTGFMCYEKNMDDVLQQIQSCKNVEETPATAGGGIPMSKVHFGGGSARITTVLRISTVLLPEEWFLNPDLN